MLYTVKPHYLATFGPGHKFGERRGWPVNGGSTRMRPGDTRGQVFMSVQCAVGL